MKIKHYLPNVLLTALMVFALLPAECLLLVRCVMLRPETFAAVTQEQALADKAYASLVTYFTTRENSTGIPKEVFLDTLDKEALETGINESVTRAFEYLTGKAENFSVSMDFSEMESAVRAFFEDYADTNGFKKDEVYEQKIAEVLSEAEGEVLFIIDTFKFSVMQENGWLGRIKTYLHWLPAAMIGGVMAVVILFFLLILCNRKQLLHLCYWAGMASLLAGGLLLVPCIYVRATDFFSGFVIKDPQIFAAVTGYLEKFVSSAIGMAAVTAGCGIVLLVLFGVLLHKKNQQREPKDAPAA